MGDAYTFFILKIINLTLAAGLWAHYKRWSFVQDEYCMYGKWSDDALLAENGLVIVSVT